MPENEISKVQEEIWKELSALKRYPIYPAIIRRVSITSTEEEYFDHELSYEEKYQEELSLREGFVIAAVEEKGQLLGIGDCIILDIAKRALLRAPLVKRCGVVLPLLPYQGMVTHPRDYLDFGDHILQTLTQYRNSSLSSTLFCLDARSISE